MNIFWILLIIIPESKPDCQTLDGKSCQFPFLDKYGNQYKACIWREEALNANCFTELYSNRTGITTSIRECNLTTCAVQCPNFSQWICNGKCISIWDKCGNLYRILIFFFRF